MSLAAASQDYGGSLVVALVFWQSTAGVSFDLHFARKDSDQN